MDVSRGTLSRRIRFYPAFLTGIWQRKLGLPVVRQPTNEAAILP